MSCDLSATNTLYVDRDNALAVIPYSDIVQRINYDMTDVTRVLVEADPVGSTSSGDATEGDSAVDADLVTWADNNPEDQWRIYCKVGLFTGIEAGEYVLRITLFDSDHPNGLVLTDPDNALLVTLVGLP